MLSYVNVGLLCVDVCNEGGHCCYRFCVFIVQLFYVTQCKQSMRSSMCYSLSCFTQVLQVMVAWIQKQLQNVSFYIQFKNSTFNAIRDGVRSIFLQSLYQVTFTSYLLHLSISSLALSISTKKFNKVGSSRLGRNTKSALMDSFGWQNLPHLT